MTDVERPPASQQQPTPLDYPVGTLIVLSGYDGPGATWFRIPRGWINGFGSEVPLPWSGVEQKHEIVHRGA